MATASGAVTSRLTIGEEPETPPDPATSGPQAMRGLLNLWFAFSRQARFTCIFPVLLTFGSTLF